MARGHVARTWALAAIAAGLAACGGSIDRAEVLNPAFLGVGEVYKVDARAAAEVVLRAAGNAQWDRVDVDGLAPNNWVFEVPRGMNGGGCWARVWTKPLEGGYTAVLVAVLKKYPSNAIDCPDCAVTRFHTEFIALVAPKVLGEVPAK